MLRLRLVTCTLCECMRKMADYARIARLVWAFLSIAVAAISTASYLYDATWVGGKPKFNGTDAKSTVINMSTIAFVAQNGGAVKFTFSTFRRCNHWIVERTDSGYRYAIDEKCAGYRSFSGDDGTVFLLARGELVRLLVELHAVFWTS